MNCPICNSKLNPVFKFQICSNHKCGARFEEEEGKLVQKDVKRLLLLYYNAKSDDEEAFKFHRDFILTFNYEAEKYGILAVAEKLNIAEHGINEIYMNLLENCPYDIIFDRITHVLNENWGLMTRLAAINGTVVVPKEPYNMYNNKAHDYHVIQKLVEQGLIDCEMPKTTMVLTSDWSRAKDGKIEIDLKSAFEKIGGKFPCYIKQAFGGAWQHVYKCENLDELADNYFRVKDRHMTMQENVDYVEFVRCFIFGYKCVRVVKYAPANPLHARYVKEENFLPKDIENRIKKAAEDICKCLGYYINSAEFGVTKDGKIYAIDFTNETIDMNPQTVSDYFYTLNLHSIVELFVSIAAKPFKPHVYPSISEFIENRKKELNLE